MPARKKSRGLTPTSSASPTSLCFTWKATFINSFFLEQPSARFNLSADCVMDYHEKLPTESHSSDWPKSGVTKSLSFGYRCFLHVTEKTRGCPTKKLGTIDLKNLLAENPHRYITLNLRYNHFPIEHSMPIYNESFTCITMTIISRTRCRIRSIPIPINQSCFP